MLNESAMKMWLEEKAKEREEMLAYIRRFFERTRV